MFGIKIAFYTVFLQVFHAGREGNRTCKKQGSTDRTGDGRTEGMMIVFIDGSLDGTTKKIFDRPVLRNRLVIDEG